MNQTVRYLLILSLSLLVLAACKIDKTAEDDSPQNEKSCAIDENFKTVNKLSTGSGLLSPCAIHNGRVKCWGENWTAGANLESKSLKK